MDKVVKSLEAYLNEREAEYVQSIQNLPEWKLNTYLPSKMHNEKMDSKIEYLINNVLRKSPIFKLIEDDINFITVESPSRYVALSQMKLLNIDDRMLESMGLNERMKNRHYQFINAIKEIIQGP